MQEVGSMAVEALDKEVKYEKYAEAEELDREVLEELEDRKSMELLKSSNECMEREERKAAELSRATLAEA